MSISAFDIEKLRQKFAELNKLSELSRLYDKKYSEIKNENTGKKWDKLNKFEITSQTYPMAFFRIEYVCSKINGNNISVLDYGFGNAKLESMLWENKVVIDLLGLDISENSVAKASKHFPLWKFRTIKTQEIKLPKGKFDYIIAMEVLEHIRPSKILNLLKKFRMAIKKDGILIISIPLNEDLEKMVKSKENVNSHLRMYTPELISAELKISGFKVIEKKYLYAFHKLFKLKSFFVRYMLKNLKKPNNLIIIAEKI